MESPQASNSPRAQMTPSTMIFNTLDTNLDGFITADDLRNSFQDDLVLHEQVPTFFEFLDTEGIGRITLEQFRSAFNKLTPSLPDSPSVVKSLKSSLETPDMGYSSIGSEKGSFDEVSASPGFLPHPKPRSTPIDYISTPANKKINSKVLKILRQVVADSPLMSPMQSNSSSPVTSHVESTPMHNVHTLEHERVKRWRSLMDELKETNTSLTKRVYSLESSLNKVALDHSQQLRRSEILQKEVTILNKEKISLEANVMQLSSDLIRLQATIKTQPTNSNSFLEKSSHPTPVSAVRYITPLNYIDVESPSVSFRKLSARESFDIASSHGCISDILSEAPTFQSLYHKWKQMCLTNSWTIHDLENLDEMEADIRRLKFQISENEKSFLRAAESDKVVNNISEPNAASVVKSNKIDRFENYEAKSWRKWMSINTSASK